MAKEVFFFINFPAVGRTVIVDIADKLLTATSSRRPVCDFYLDMLNVRRSYKLPCCIYNFFTIGSTCASEPSGFASPARTRLWRVP